MFIRLPTQSNKIEERRQERDFITCGSDERQMIVFEILIRMTNDQE